MLQLTFTPLPPFLGGGNTHGRPTLVQVPGPGALTDIPESVIQVQIIVLLFFFLSDERISYANDQPPPLSN